MSDIELLLASADSGEPVLSQGMEWTCAANGPKPDQEEATGGDFRADGADPNDLEAQRWGLVVPADAALGNRLLGLVEPLVRARRQQQGAEPIVYRVPRGLGPEESARWWNEVYQDEDIDESDRPRYLLILGDADLISWDLQQRLALDVFVGRLAFPSDDGYAAYVAKVLAHEARRPADGARALFHTVRDGTAATNAGHDGLMVPSVATAREGKKKGTFDAKEIVLLGEDSGSVSLDDFYGAVAADTPSLLFSVSHGLGAPRKGWGSREEQRRFQGAMSLGGGQRLTHEDVATRPFLPGGAWFFFACLGAGTPTSSAYHHWLKDLKDVGLFGGPLDDVLRSLPAPGEPPFVARLPQAALANENGPLSVLGHVDLAWTFGFQEYVVKDGKKVAKNRPSRFQDIFRELVSGKRMGAGYTALQRFFNNANGDLTTIYDQEARARARSLPLDDDPIKKMRKATLWMERQDLSAYVLLGDPAVRLNVAPARAQPAVSSPIPSIASVLDATPPTRAQPVVSSPPPSINLALADTLVDLESPAAEERSPVRKLADVEAMERAILSVLSEETTAKKAAEKLGVERDDVQTWVSAYQRAGRAALQRL